MKTKVKICGIQSYKDAKTSILAGAAFLGFNFVPTSKRFINTDLTKEIIDRLPNKIAKVGVFMDAQVKEVNRLISYLKLDYVQLHGKESPKYVEMIKNAGVIKTISLPANFDVEQTIKKMKKYKVDYFLLDREIQGRGKPLDLMKVKQLAVLFPVFLAGGLTPENIKRRLSFIVPYAVDVAGGVETNGKKDIKKIERFMREVKIYD